MRPQSPGPFSSSGRFAVAWKGFPFMLLALFPRPLLRSLLVLTALLASSPLSFGQGAASGTADIEIPTVTASGHAATSIAIPAFDIAGNRPATLDVGFFRNIIYRDLEWFSDFARAKNQQFVEQTHLRDRKAGNVDFAEWQRLGANFVLKGEIEIAKGKVVLSCHLHDVIYGTRVFGLQYRYPLDQARRLAHRVSNDIMRSVFGVEQPIAGTRIAFVKQARGSLSKELFLIDVDGFNEKRLTFDNSIALTPAWGKNATEVYYTSFKDNNTDLCGIQLGSGKQWFISRRPQLNYAPAWHPEREKIALTLGKDGNDEIYTMDREGKARTLKRLTHSASIDTSASWNPSGDQIVFNSRRTGHPQIHVMNSDGTNVRRLTRQGRYNVSPVWSPKGDRIAFVGQDQGAFNVYTMKVDGSDWWQLTDKGNNEDPCWAPDGEHLVFMSNRTGSDQLWIMRDDGSNLRQITSKGTNQSPAWSPLLK
jgi:TolB protein